MFIFESSYFLIFKSNISSLNKLLILGLALTLLKGGADSGFNRVLPEAYKPRLFHVKKQNNRRITCTEVSLKRGNLTSEDVFIFDLGDKIYQVSSCSDNHYKAINIYYLKNAAAEYISILIYENILNECK